MTFEQIYWGIIRQEPAAEEALEGTLGPELWAFCLDRGFDKTTAFAKVREVLILIVDNAYADYGGGHGPRLIVPARFEEWCWEVARQFLVRHWAQEEGALHPHFRKLYALNLDFEILLARLPPAERAAVLELESLHPPAFRAASRRLKVPEPVLRFAYQGGIQNLERLVTRDRMLKARDPRLRLKVTALHGQTPGAVRVRFYELVHLKRLIQEAWPQLTGFEARTLQALGNSRPSDYAAAAAVLRIRPETVRAFEEKALLCLHMQLRRDSQMREMLRVLMCF